MVANRVENVKEGQVLFDKLNAVVTPDILRLHGIFGVCTTGSPGGAGSNAAGACVDTESGSKIQSGISENCGEIVR